MVGTLRCPYVGLRPFQRDEASIFFGRETHVDEMVDRLARHRLLAVTGTSSSGKSSLVQAGLIEGLELGLLAEAGSDWRIVLLRPSNDPMTTLAEGFLNVASETRYEHDVVHQRAALERGPLSLVEALRVHPLPEAGNLLVIVDQFEELFRYQALADREEAEAFVSLLLASSRQRDVPIYVVITLRSDFFGECARFEGLPEAISDALYLCPRLTRDQILTAIREPAAVWGGRVEAGLANRIVNEMGTDPDQLPLMQHLLMRLWQRALVRDPATPTLSMEDYAVAGGLRDSLSLHADEILGEIDPGDRIEIARKLFCLLTEGDGNRAVRRPALMTEIMAVTDRPPDDIIPVVDMFRAPDRNLLVPALDVPLTPNTILDISHESLIRQWHTLNDWIRVESESAARYRGLVERARYWHNGQAALLGSPDLDVALLWLRKECPTVAWAERYGDHFELVLQYLEASQRDLEANQRDLEARQRTARRWRLQRPLVLTACLIILVALVALIFASR